MSNSVIEELEAAGAPVDLLSDGQRQVLQGLTSDEAAILASVQHRLAALPDEDVEGQTVVGAGVF